MWISNTATAAMMMAIVVPLVKSAPEGFRRAVILAVPFGANIGGIGTPIGTPPNAIGLANLRAAGVDVGFVQWMLAAVPLMLLLLGITGIVLYVLFRPAATMRLTPLQRADRRLDNEGWLVCAVLAMAIVLWLTTSWHGINEAVVALLAAACLTALRVLERHDVDSIDWNILLLMWGGLSLSNAMQLTGLTAWIGQLPLTAVPSLALPLLFVILALGLSTFMSNTAAANLLIPIAMIVSGATPLHLALLTAFGCSLAMALPISTPPNAIAYASGGVTTKDMVAVGSIIAVIGVVILLLGHEVVLPVMLR